MRHTLATKSSRFQDVVGSMRLKEGTAIFLARLRADGREHLGIAYNLHRFCNWVGDLAIDQITSNSIQMFLDGPRTFSTATWQMKHSALSRFFDFWVQRGQLTQSRMPRPRPSVRRVWSPHIYTRQEILLLLDTIRHHPNVPSLNIHPETMRAFTLTLYGVGARIVELRKLQTRDLDLRRGFLQIGNQKFGQARRIPINRDLRAILERYTAWKERNGVNGCDTFFARSNGMPVDKFSLNRYFERVRRKAGLVRHDGRKALPTLRELRSTFAVHRITSWIKGGADLNLMLPALSAYMGQAELTSSDRFLRLTPERFRKELNSLSPKRSRKHWRDDSMLLTFLAGL